jgi:hypothetical protein
LAGRPALLSLGGSKLLPFKNDGGHCVLGDIQCCRNVFGTLPQICATTQSCLGFLRTIPFDLMAWYFGLTCSVICGTLYRQVCAFSKSCPITWIDHQVDSNQVVETSQGWSSETGCARAQFESHSNGSEYLCKYVFSVFIYFEYIR